MKLTRSRGPIALALVAAVAIVVAAVALRPAASTGTSGTLAAADPGTITVYKNAGCRCCDSWADQMGARGHEMVIDASHDLDEVYAHYGVRPGLQSCHLATVGKYIVVGHVPPAEVEALLERGDDVVGLLAPGMPAGSPGMEAGGREDEYQVLVLEKGGVVRPLARYRGTTRLN